MNSDTNPHFNTRFANPIPADVPPRIWDFYSMAWIGATDALFPQSRIVTDSAEKIIVAQQKVNEELRKAKAADNGGYYGIFCG